MPSKEEGRTCDKDDSEEAEHCHSISTLEYTSRPQVTLTTGEHLLQCDLFFEEERTSDRRAHRREKRQHGRVRQGEVLQCIVGSEEPNEPGDAGQSNCGHCGDWETLDAARTPTALGLRAVPVSLLAQE